MHYETLLRDGSKAGKMLLTLLNLLLLLTPSNKLSEITDLA